jgi:predicted deacylase
MTLKTNINKLPQGLLFAIVAIVANVIIYGLLFFIEKPVSFSYAGNNCVKYPLLLPSIQTVQTPADFKVFAKDEVKIMDTPLLATSLCFSPSSAPKQGNEKVSLAPFGGWLAKKTFSVDVPKPVLAHQDTLARLIPVTRDLPIKLEKKDVIFSYALQMNEKTAPCKPHDEGVVCDIQSLDLRQGEPYSLSLSRLFQGKEVGSVIDKKTVQTLPAARLTDSSIKSGEVVFSKPKTIDLMFDKKLTKHDVALYRREGDKKTKISIETKVSEQGLTLLLDKDLPRSSDFELAINSVEAADGSGLEDPVTLPFKVSGGPKVTGINVGKTGTQVGATVVVTFDQPISEAQDTTKALKLGGGASYAGKKANQILVSLKNTPKCGDFTIEVGDTLQSNFDIAGGSQWSFTGRTLCYTVGAIGYSAAGRPITAYYFGNGSRTVAYTGAIHGNEVGTKYLMDRWVQELEANGRSIPADKSVVVIPSLNPDGVAAGTRTNKRNVDLNRNFSVSDWQKDITDVNNRPFPGGGGEAPMSESETKAIASFVRQQRPSFIMSYHSIGGVLAANQAGDSVSRAAAYSQLSGYRNVTGQSAQTFDYSITGTADDWYAETMGIPSVLVELSSHTSAQFDRNQKAMWKMLTL